MQNKLLQIGLLVLISLIARQPVLAQSAENPVVQAVLFYSPTCPHCHEVIENVLPPLKEQYGSQLQLIGIDTSKQTGSQLYDTAADAFDIPRERLGVPALIVGTTVLVGSAEIPDQFPDIIKSGLQNGGISWPAIPGLAEYIPDLPPPARELTQNESSDPAAITTAGDTMTDALAEETAGNSQDPAGFAIAWGVMLAMLLALVNVVWRLYYFKPQGAFAANRDRGLSSWAIPILSIIGLGIACYLSYVEIKHVSAVCGPIGQCNLVQSSPYAQILDVPVAVLGALFYLSVIGVWLLLKQAVNRHFGLLAGILTTLTIAGTLFSIYLTAIEIFVIHAVCAWCLTSAIVRTALMLIVVSAVTKVAPEADAGQSAAQLN